VEMGYLTGLEVRSGAKIGDLHAKDSNTFCKRLIVLELQGHKVTAEQS